MTWVKETVGDITLINHSTSMIVEIIVHDYDGISTLWLENYQLKQLLEAIEKTKEHL